MQIAATEQKKGVSGGHTGVASQSSGVSWQVRSARQRKRALCGQVMAAPHLAKAEFWECFSFSFSFFWGLSGFQFHTIVFRICFACVRA